MVALKLVSPNSMIEKTTPSRVELCSTANCFSRLCCSASTWITFVSFAIVIRLSIIVIILSRFSLCLISAPVLLPVMEPARPILIQPKELVPWHHWYELKSGKFWPISPAEFTKRTGIDAFYILSVPVQDMCDGWEPEPFRNCWYVGGEDKPNPKPKFKDRSYLQTTNPQWGVVHKKLSKKMNRVAQILKNPGCSVPVQINGIAIGSMHILRITNESRSNAPLCLSLLDTA